MSQTNAAEQRLKKNLIIQGAVLGALVLLFILSLLISPKRGPAEYGDMSMFFSPDADVASVSFPASYNSRARFSIDMRSPPLCACLSSPMENSLTSSFRKTGLCGE